MKRISIIVVLALVALIGCQSQPTASNQKNVDARIDVRVRWAQEHIQQRQYESAKRPLTQALEIDPNNPKVLNLLAYVFQQQGEMKLAEEYYQRMQAAAPDFASGQNNFGIFLMIQGRYDEACEQFKLATDNPLYEGRPRALENLASCYSSQGKTVEAEKIYRQVIGLTPDAPNAYVGLASILYDQGNKGDARALFETFSEMVERRRANHTSSSLWLGVRLSRDENDVGMSATYALLLKNMFPNSSEYQRYKESRQ